MGDVVLGGSFSTRNGPRGWGKDSWILEIQSLLGRPFWVLRIQRAGHLDTWIPGEQRNLGILVLWLSEEALQIGERREAKSKGEKERYKHLNAEFQRIARRDKKTFLTEQHKELEENNRMGNLSERAGGCSRVTSGQRVLI